MFGMMGSKMANSQLGQQTQGFNGPFGNMGGPMGGGVGAPQGQGKAATGDMAMKDGGMDVMGSIDNINRNQQDMMNNPGISQNAGGVGFSNPFGGMLGSVFKVF